MKRPFLVWDVPVRIFHWLLAGGFVAAYVLGETLDDDDPSFILHMAVGLTVGLLAALRIAWGIFGSAHARFSDLALSPAALVRYLRGVIGKPPPAYLGHNPATSYAALGMLGCALGLALSGIMLASGNESVAEVHEVLATCFLLLSVAHVVGVVWHAIRYRDGILLGILDGRKAGDPGTQSVRPHRMVGVVLAILLAGWGGVLVAGYDANTRTLALPGLRLTIDDDHERDHQDRDHRERDHHERDHRDRGDRDHDGDEHHRRNRHDHD